MAEDFDDHRRIFDGGDDLQSPAAVGAVFDIDVEDPFEQSGPAHAQRFSLGRGVIGWWLGGTLCRSGNDFSAQLGVGRQHAMDGPLHFQTARGKLCRRMGRAGASPLHPQSRNYQITQITKSLIPPLSAADAPDEEAAALIDDAHVAKAEVHDPREELKDIGTSRPVDGRLHI